MEGSFFLISCRQWCAADSFFLSLFPSATFQACLFFCLQQPACGTYVWRVYGPGFACDVNVRLSVVLQNAVTLRLSAVLFIKGWGTLQGLGSLHLRGAQNERKYCSLHMLWEPLLHIILNRAAHFNYNEVSERTSVKVSSLSHGMSFKTFMYFEFLVLDTAIKIFNLCKYILTSNF